MAKPKQNSLDAMKQNMPDAPRKSPLQSLLDAPRVQDRIEKVLGKRANTFASSIITVASNNKLLSTAEPKSILAAAMIAAALDLSIDQNLGLFYIVPYKNNKTGITSAQGQLGYKGLIQLCLRSGQYETINVVDIREGEIISRDRLTGEIDFAFIADDVEREKTKIAGYVAYFRTLGGFKKTLYMSIPEIEAHGKKFSKTYNYKGSSWQSNFEAMAKKTVLKSLLNTWGPKSVELNYAMGADQAVVKDITDIPSVEEGFGDADYDDNDRKDFVDADFEVEGDVGTSPDDPDTWDVEPTKGEQGSLLDGMGV